MSHSALVSQPSGDFPVGYTQITSATDSECNTGIEFGVHIFHKNESFEHTDEWESAWLLIQGKAEIRWPGGEAIVERESLFTENPSVLSLPSQTPLKIRALSDRVEWARMRTPNSAHFEPQLFLPSDVSSEARGLGLVNNACLRTVRLVFDRERRKGSNLVLGEVVNFPGRWSSYPPHHHTQPEIYHYRFSLPKGYGHAELGETLLKIRNHDTIKISGGLDHAQVSAPGYGMYYLWVVRHLPNQPYEGFVFDPDHEWIVQPDHPSHQQEVLCRLKESL